MVAGTADLTLAICMTLHWDRQSHLRINVRGCTFAIRRLLVPQADRKPNYHGVQTLQTRDTSDQDTSAPVPNCL